MRKCIRDRSRLLFQAFQPISDSRAKGVDDSQLKIDLLVSGIQARDFFILRLGFNRIPVVDILNCQNIKPFSLREIAGQGDRFG